MDLLAAIDIAIFRHLKSQEYRRMELNSVREALRCINKPGGLNGGSLAQFPEILQNIIPFDYFTCLKTSNRRLYIRDFGFLRTHFREYQLLGFDELATISAYRSAALQALSLECTSLNHPLVRVMHEFEELAGRSGLMAFYARYFSLKSCLCYPLLMPDGSVEVMCFLSKAANTYHQEHVQKLDILRSLLESAFDKVLHKSATSAVNENRQVVTPVKDKTNEAFAGIVGQSSSVLMIFDLVRKVAMRDTSVLILGENGTGKEKIARSIHSLSGRKSGPFIIVNCASLPAELIESELFGHEKGAFTGAVEARIGKFELASGGTIFLDEIGEMPLNAQVKLLRALQQREIERVGGRSTIAVDIRIIAATNRNLEKEVASGKFRMDLYYRLNVFPVTMPPLRERKEDIPLLVEYFLDQQSARTGTHMCYEITPDVLNQLLNYDWPGNVRELENFIERAVVLSSSPVIDNLSLLTGERHCKTYDDKVRIMTIEENEREHIINVLRICKSKIYGPGGAAELLNVPPTTLSSKIKKLGIVKGGW
jgi:transcriptional regulator with GAF, ATPase, and Fis domain